MIELARPWLLLLLPLPFLAWRYLPALPARAVLLVPDGVRALLLGLSPERRGALGESRLLRWLRGLGWMALVLALAGPFTRGAILERPTGRDLVVAIDLSSSMEENMLVEGESVPRYRVVRDLMSRFITERRGDRIGLVAFGHEAFMIAPLSFDVGAVAGMLDELVIGLPGHRTDLGRAVGLTVKVMREQKSAARVLVLLSDGEDNTGALTGLNAAHLAAANGITIYTIGFSAKLDTDGMAILRGIAEATPGTFFSATSASALAEITERIDAIEPTGIDGPPEHLVRDWTIAMLGLALAMLAGFAFELVREA